MWRKGHATHPHYRSRAFPSSFPALRRSGRTSAGAAGGVEVVLVGAAVVLALPEQQNSGGVTAGSTGPGRAAGQALAVAG